MTFPLDVLDEIHLFWFGKLADSNAKAPEKAPIWFAQSDETDQTIRDRFGGYLDDAANADWELGALTREQQVGLVILLDQFPRNIFRTTGDAFAYDERVRDIANSLLARGIETFYRAERLFVVLPLMHSEAIADQDRCLMLLAEQAITAPEEWVEDLRTALDFSTKHRDLIRKFGRFPHRNEMLGRKTTEEEAAFLAEHGRGF